MRQGTDNSKNPGTSADWAPGQTLHQLRREQGLDADTIRRQLGLTKTLFEALERDDVERLPAPVYVRGYLRRYAELVGARPPAMLASYQRMLENKGLVERPDQKPVESGRPVKAMVGSALGLLLATSLVFGAILSDSDSPETAPDSAHPAADGAATVQREPEAAVTATGVPDSHQLQLTFVTDSWVEVVDARDHILAVSLQRSGDYLKLEGVPPFQIKLGYGPGVTVTYMDKALEFEADPETHAVDATVGFAISP